MNGNAAKPNETDRVKTCGRGSRPRKWCMSWLARKSPGEDLPDCSSPHGCGWIFRSPDLNSTLDTPCPRVHVPRMQHLLAGPNGTNLLAPAPQRPNRAPAKHCPLPRRGPSPIAGTSSSPQGPVRLPARHHNHMRRVQKASRRQRSLEPA